MEQQKDKEGPSIQLADPGRAHSGTAEGLKQFMKNEWKRYFATP